MNFMTKRILVITAGAVISAFGITLALSAGFGGATLAVLWQGFSKTFGISLGTSSAVVAVFMILFALVYDKHQINIGTVLYQIFYSGFVEVFSNILTKTNSPYINILIMLIGIFCFAVGTGIYSSADWGRGSYEAVTFAIAEKNGFQAKNVRIILDIIVVVIGVILGGKIGICTVATVFLSGPIIQFSKSKAENILFSKTHR